MFNYTNKIKNFVLKQNFKQEKVQKVIEQVHNFLLLIEINPSSKHLFVYLFIKINAKERA